MSDLRDLLNWSIITSLRETGRCSLGRKRRFDLGHLWLLPETFRSSFPRFVPVEPARPVRLEQQPPCQCTLTTVVGAAEAAGRAARWGPRKQARPRASPSHASLARAAPRTPSPPRPFHSVPGHHRPDQGGAATLGQDNRDRQLFVAKHSLETSPSSHVGKAVNMLVVKS